MCACDDSVSRAEKFRRSIDGLKRGALIGCHPRNFCAQNDVFVGVRVGFVLRLNLENQIGMGPPPPKKKIGVVFHCRHVSSVDDGILGFNSLGDSGILVELRFTDLFVVLLNRAR